MPAGAALPLAYGVPDPSPAIYEFSDTARFEVESGAMGTLNVLVAQSGTAELAFRPRGDAFHVSIRFPSLSATFQNPGQGAANADETAISGAFGVRVGRGGAVEVVDTPSLAPPLRQIAGPEALVRAFFVRLPDREVSPGARWVDTVTTEEETGGTRSVSRSVVTSTLVGDTVVDGRRSLLISTRSEVEVEVTGESGGVAVDQRMSGSTRGAVVWDHARNVLVARHEAGRLTGTLELPGMAVPGMPVNGTVARTVRLRPSEGQPPPDEL